MDKLEGKNYPKIKNAVLLCLLLIAIQLGLSGLTGLILGLLGFGTDSLPYGIGIILTYIIPFAVVILIGYKKTGKNSMKSFFSIKFH